MAIIPNPSLAALGSLFASTVKTNSHTFVNNIHSPDLSITHCTHDTFSIRSTSIKTNIFEPGHIFVYIGDNVNNADQKSSIACNSCSPLFRKIVTVNEENPTELTFTTSFATYSEVFENSLSLEYAYDPAFADLYIEPQFECDHSVIATATTSGNDQNVRQQAEVEGVDEGENEQGEDEPTFAEKVDFILEDRGPHDGHDHSWDYNSADYDYAYTASSDSSDSSGDSVVVADSSSDDADEKNVSAALCLTILILLVLTAFTIVLWPITAFLGLAFIFLDCQL